MRRHIRHITSLFRLFPRRVLFHHRVLFHRGDLFPRRNNRINDIHILRTVLAVHGRDGLLESGLFFRRQLHHLAACRPHLFLRGLLPLLPQLPLITGGFLGAFAYDIPVLLRQLLPMWPGTPAEAPEHGCVRRSYNIWQPHSEPWTHRKASYSPPRR